MLSLLAKAVNKLYNFYHGGGMCMQWTWLNPYVHVGLMWSMCVWMKFWLFQAHVFFFQPSSFENLLNHTNLIWIKAFLVLNFFIYKIWIWIFFKKKQLSNYLNQELYNKLLVLLDQHFSNTPTNFVLNISLAAPIINRRKYVAILIFYGVL